MLSILTKYIFFKTYFIAYPKKNDLLISLVKKSDFQGFLFQFCQVGELDRCHPEPAPHTDASQNGSEWYSLFVHTE